MAQDNTPRPNRPQRPARGGRPPQQGGPRRGRQGGRPRQQGGRPVRGSRQQQGYPLRPHNIKFQGNGGIGNIGGYDPRALAMLGGAILLVAVLLFGAVSCVRGCASSKKPETVGAEGSDSRIAAGVSDNLKAQLTMRLDDDDALASIAKNAGKYTDEAIIQLALDDSGAIGFVKKVPGAQKTASAYTDAVTKGTVPMLLSYDSRWGFSDYAGLPLGVSGSGPTCLSMAYMGLTGKNDKYPADVAKIATDDGYASGDYYTKETFFSKDTSKLGLYCETPAPSADEIVGSLSNAHPIICLVKADTLTSRVHYVICAGINADGTINVYDPTCSTVAAHPWAAATIAGYSTKMFVIHPANSTASDAADSTDGTDGTTTSDGTDVASRSDANSTDSGTTE